MTFVDALGILVRRWYLVVLGVAVTAVLATLSAYRWDDGRLVNRFAPQYETSAVVSVTAIDPTAPIATAAPRVAYSLQAIVESGSFGRRIGAKVPGWHGGSIKASVPNQTSIIELLVAGPTPAAADAAMDEVIGELPAVAAPLVRPPSVAPVAPEPFTIDVAGTPTPAAEQPSTKGPLSLALVTLLGLGATWALTLSVERARVSRGARRAADVYDVRDPVEPEVTPSRRVPELAGDGVRR